MGIAQAADLIAFTRAVRRRVIAIEEQLGREEDPLAALLIARARDILGRVEAIEAALPPARPQARLAGWRPCGYPGCSPRYCDDCEGRGFDERWPEGPLSELWEREARPVLAAAGAWRSSRPASERVQLPPDRMEDSLIKQGRAEGHCATALHTTFAKIDEEVSEPLCDGPLSRTLVRARSSNLPLPSQHFRAPRLDFPRCAPMAPDAWQREANDPGLTVDRAREMANMVDTYYEHQYVIAMAAWPLLFLEDPTLRDAVEALIAEIPF